MSHEAIAMVLGISRPTLEKHFAHELAGGAFQRRFEALQGLHAAAKKGNVSAVKAYLAATPEFVPELPAKSEPAKPAAVAAPLGKKAAADAAALTAQHGTQWEDLLPGSPVQ